MTIIKASSQYQRVTYFLQKKSLRSIFYSWFLIRDVFLKQVSGTTGFYLTVLYIQFLEYLLNSKNLCRQKIKLWFKGLDFTSLRICLWIEKWKVLCAYHCLTIKIFKFSRKKFFPLNWRLYYKSSEFRSSLNCLKTSNWLKSKWNWQTVVFWFPARKRSSTSVF